jgi:hypothetical protein
MRMGTGTGVRSAHKITQLVGFALLGSVVVYVAVGMILASAAPESIGSLGKAGFAPMLELVLLAAALGAVTLSWPIKAAIAADGSVQRLSTACIVAFALSESAAIVGLVLFFLLGKPTYLFALAAVSAVAIAAHLPRLAEWEARTRGVPLSRPED